MLEPEQDDFLRSIEREIRLYLSYAEANVVRTKVAQILQDRAAVSRLKSIAGGWAFTIQRTTGENATTTINQGADVTEHT